jgi:precorrin-2 dehydrogenase/sirohydrochlorin ferrochelatase
MIPADLNPSELNFGLIGRGDVLRSRLRFLLRGGVKKLKVFSDQPSEEIPERIKERIVDHLPVKGDLRGLDVLYISGLMKEEARPFVKMARQSKILVNCEDVREFCDFYTPAIVRRGDLVITASTAGISPGLAKRLRKYLAGVFGAEWKQRLEEIGKAREVWKENGASLKELNSMTNAMIDENDWMP